MPNLFIPNAEDALSKDDKYFAENFACKTFNMYPRFLCSLKSGDRLIVPRAVDQAYAEYMCRLLNLGRPEDVLIQIELSDCSLTHSILNNPSNAEKIKSRIGSDFFIEPYIQNENITALSRFLSIPIKRSSDNIMADSFISGVNNKHLFKYIALGAGCSIINGTYADNAEELKFQIRLLDSKISQHKKSKIMLRKAKYAGGMGNLYGTAEELLSQIDSWYNSGTVLIEPYLDFISVCGSLTMIEKEGISFIGTDEQIFHNNRWCGFIYPSDQPQEASGKIKADSLKLAEALHKQHIYGLMNLDWGISIENGHPQPLLLECNMRHNGLSYILDLAQYCIKNYKNAFIYNFEHITTKHTAETALRILSKTAVNGTHILIEESGRQSGLILTAPPSGGSASAAAFAETKAQALEIMEAAVQALA